MLQEQRILFLVRRILSFIHIAQDARQVKYEFKKKEVETSMAINMVVDVVADEVLDDQAINNNISQNCRCFLAVIEAMHMSQVRGIGDGKSLVTRSFPMGPTMSKNNVGVVNP